MHEEHIATPPSAKTVEGIAESPQRQCCHPRLCSVSQVRSKGYYSELPFREFVLVSESQSQEMVRQQMEAQRVEMQLASEAVLVTCSFCSFRFLLCPC